MMLDTVALMYAKEIFCCQKFFETLDPLNVILACMDLKNSLAWNLHLPWVSITNGTNSFDVAITFLYFVNFNLAFNTAAAPGKYDANISESLTKPLEGLFASTVFFICL